MTLDQLTPLQTTLTPEQLQAQELLLDLELAVDRVGRFTRRANEAVENLQGPNQENVRSQIAAILATLS